MFNLGERKDRPIYKVFFCGSLLAMLLGLAATIGGAQSTPAPMPQNPATPEKTAAEVYKNIQVLKDIPASQLVPGMRYITVALGVRCDFCHVNPFEKDDKREKQTARHMMKMMFELNKANFNGRPEISCYTCHRGHAEPMSVVALPADTTPAIPIPSMPSATPAPLPTVEEVINKYAEALGGQTALDKITSRVIRGKQVGENKAATAFEMYQKGPNKDLTVTTTDRGILYTGYDGTKVWTTANRGQVSDLASIVIHWEAEINPVAALRLYTNARVLGRRKIGDQEVIAVRGRAPDGNFEFLLFDANTGLLVRRSLRMQTVFGALPLQIDYADYRKVDGVAVPFKTTLWMSEGNITRVIEEVQDNVPIENAKFEKAPENPSAANKK